ncbi:MAG: hypothetical protein IKN73_01875 [Alphaproteobacteria bacterium]|nr:hypothetical protein [Alphaproteobacteria bacterium]
MAIASTAISSFNNAALFSPLFLVVAVLMAPLFLMVYKYGKSFVSEYGWNKNNFENKIILWTSVITGLWLILFGGNYAVMRDSISLLPTFISFVLFCLTTIVFQQLSNLGYLQKIQCIKHKNLYALLCLLIVALSGVMTWWGVLLQISAVLCGMIVGCRLKRRVSLFGLMSVLSVLVVLILMQPEYFRFGQLGNLTFIHLISVFITLFFVVTALVVKYVKTAGKIHDSAYIKLKWMFRIFSILALVLFILTESVPIFIGLLVCIGISECLTVYHSKNINNDIIKMSISLFLLCFGVITICPLISSLGIIYMLYNPNNIKAKDYIDLL